MLAWRAAKSCQSLCHMPALGAARRNPFTTALQDAYNQTLATILGCPRKNVRYIRAVARAATGRRLLAEEAADTSSNDWADVQEDESDHKQVGILC